MKLSALLKDLEVQEIYGSKSIEITGISNHSKRVSPGNLFIAKRGQVTDGNLYTPEAVASGAVAILSDIYDPSLKNVTQIIHPSMTGLEGELIARYYGYPSQELLTIGVTGTKGKTTTTYLIRHLLESQNRRSGLIGTVEYIVGHQQYPATHTTPDVLTNHRMLRQMIQENCQAAVMEVSSHALDQDRLYGIDCDVAVFTNLTPDHLDYHGTYQNYIEAKQKLFQKCERAVYNADSPEWEKVLSQCSVETLSYGLISPADVTADQIQMSSEGSRFQVTCNGDTILCESPLVGIYNVSNVLAAIAAIVACGYPFQSTVAAVKSFHQVPGRMELVRNALGRKVFVDYAHSGESLRSVLECLHGLKKGRIITVFGCGGDRDPARRVDMARAAEKYSDISIVTTDNPRSENPEKIIEDILDGFSKLDRVIVEGDRRQAIEKAIQIAANEDLILIAGKGHERFQIFLNQMVEFDDRLVVAEVCENELATI